MGLHAVLSPPALTKCGEIVRTASTWSSSELEDACIQITRKSMYSHHTNNAQKLSIEFESDPGEFLAGLEDLPRVELYAAPESVRKTPTVAFRVQGHTTEEICARMLEHGFFIAAGDFYASTLAEKLGIGDSGGFVRAGLAPYTRFAGILSSRQPSARFWYTTCR